MSTVNAKAGDAEPITAALTDSGGAPKTGLSPTLAIRCDGGTNDGKYLKSDLTWQATKQSISLVEVSAANAPGEYAYDFTLPSGEYDGVRYIVAIDGTATASPRYLWGEIIAVSTGPDDQHNVVAALTHKADEVVDPDDANFGRVRTYESDAATVRQTLTSSKTSGMLIRTPS